MQLRKSEFRTLQMCAEKGGAQFRFRGGMAHHYRRVVARGLVEQREVEQTEWRPRLRVWRWFLTPLGERARLEHIDTAG